ncbi:antibiotic biosynthesis monooxygenase [Syntrophotalea acetylenivorans]|uniref:Antibiotic biosynthesis monooxygenase n=1 Tax=Syntrophotalea acetylenivorans TaxID=1842532 RepID=A0A1L3GNH1_9BACT|nr:putative quinol monooxygenase [Syntrophotalea acetylenivorans]APG27496.1 antibiotic biosynthesis monooxygenase [Syntrophotalea acetylenivorans]
MPVQDVIVVASFKAKEGKEQAALAELSALLDPTRQEVGCIQYDLHRSTDDPGVLVFYEVWKSRQDLEQHLAMPYLQALLGKVDELFAEAPQINLLEKLD